MEERLYRKLLWYSTEARASCLPGRSMGPGMPAQAGRWWHGWGFNKSDSWRNEVPLPLPPVSVLGVLVGLGLSYLLGDSYGFRMGLTCSGGMWPLPPGTGGDLLWRRWPPSLLLHQGKCSEWIWVYLLPSPQMHSWLALILILNTFHVYYDRHIGFTPSK